MEVKIFAEGEKRKRRKREMPFRRLFFKLLLPVKALSH
jgi:hypothetical protein